MMVIVAVVEVDNSGNYFVRRCVYIVVVSGIDEKIKTMGDLLLISLEIHEPRMEIMIPY